MRTGVKNRNRCALLSKRFVSHNHTIHLGEEEKTTWKRSGEESQHSCHSIITHRHTRALLAMQVSLGDSSGLAVVHSQSVFNYEKRALLGRGKKGFAFRGALPGQRVLWVAAFDFCCTSVLLG
jgi:hypothetical protein